VCKGVMDAATEALKSYFARDSWTGYEIKTADEHPLPTTGKVLISSFCHSSSDIICFQAVVLFGQGILNF
jgi:hypothetical protein